MGRQGNAALEVFHKFEVFQCVPNHDTYYFTLQALLTTTCTPHIIHQAASICQKMLLLLPHHHDRDSSSQQDYNCTHPLPPYNNDVTASESFQSVLTHLTVPLLEDSGFQIKSALEFMDFATPRQHQQHFVLKIIETSCQTKFLETPNVPPHNLIHFVVWAWKKNKNIVTTPVLESLVTSICSPDHTEYDVELRKNNILLLWDLLKRIGHYQSGLLNTQILNQLLGFFRYMEDEGKAALEIFHKFEVFQCVPNQDTYIFTLHALFSTSCSTDVVLQQQAASICQKMVLHPETLLPDDGDILGRLFTWFSEANMIEEARSLYLAANEKRKRNPNWSLELGMFLSPIMMYDLCSKN